MTVPRASAFSAHIHVGTPTIEMEPGSNGVDPGATVFNFKLATDRCATATGSGAGTAGWG